MDLKGLGDRLEWKLKTPSTFYAFLIATHSASLPHFFLFFSKLLYLSPLLGILFFNFAPPSIMGLYRLLLNKTSWWKLESQSKFQIFRERALFCLVRHSSLDQSTAQEAKAISEKMVARGLLLPFRWEWVSWRKDSVAGKIILLNSLLSVDGTLNTWLEARDPRITGGKQITSCKYNPSQPMILAKAYLQK